MTTVSFQPYAPRSFRFIELLKIDDWRMKLYGIAWKAELPRKELIEAAKLIAADVLARETANNYKLGFIGAHDGRGACFVFVDLGEMRTICFIGCLSPAWMSRKSWSRGGQVIPPCAYGICVCKTSSAKPGSDMCSKNRMRRISRVI